MKDKLKLNQSSILLAHSLFNRVLLPVFLDIRTLSTLSTYSISSVPYIAYQQSSSNMGFSFDLAIRSDSRQPQIRIPDDNVVERSVPQHVQFLNIPTEVRNMIYSYYVEGQQEDVREYVGKHSNADKSDFCTPLFKVRPPSLIRVCTQTREEYLPIYFRETCFRVYVDFTPSGPFGPTHPLGTDLVTIDPDARSWLNSINQTQTDACFRNLQFRPVHCGGVPIGANFNITYNARKMRYQAQFVLDDSWRLTPGLYPNHTSYDRINIMPRHAWAYVKRLSEEYTQEWIDWSEVGVLTQKLHCLSGADMHDVLSRGLHRRDLEDWSDETRQICKR